MASMDSRTDKKDESSPSLLKFMNRVKNTQDFINSVLFPENPLKAAVRRYPWIAEEVNKLFPVKSNTNLKEDKQLSPMANEMLISPKPNLTLTLKELVSPKSRGKESTTNHMQTTKE